MKAEMHGPRRPPGRPKGSKDKVFKPRGPREGSRPHTLLNLEPGERCFFEAEVGRGGRLMQQIGADISRNGLQGKVSQRLLLAIEPSSREVVELVMVTRLEEDEE